MKVGDKPLISSCGKRLPYFNSKKSRGPLCETNIKSNSVAHRFCAASFCDEIKYSIVKKEQK
jgi:hypothetical protein